MQEDDTGMNRQSGIQVIARAAQIMRALSKHPQGLSLAAIAQEVDLPRSTVQRITRALADEMLVEPAGAAGGLRLGPALAQLMGQSQSDIISLIKPHLQCLSERLHESVSLCSLSGDKVYIIDRIVAERELRVMFPVGVYAPAYATAAGKVLLARLDEADLQALLPKKLQKLTEKTQTREQLLSQLQQIRRDGLAIDMDEIIDGIGSCSVVLDTCLGMYALSVIAPSVRMQADLQRIKEVLQEVRSEIERAIGREPG